MIITTMVEVNKKFNFLKAHDTFSSMYISYIIGVSPVVTTQTLTAPGSSIYIITSFNYQSNNLS
jgi:hypothetical protein